MLIATRDYMSSAYIFAKCFFVRSSYSLLFFAWVSSTVVVAGVVVINSEATCMLPVAGELFIYRIRVL